MREPVLPFEYWEVERGQRKLCRPLLYALQHMVLPQALFIRRPGLRFALLPDAGIPRDLSNLMGHAAVRCLGTQGWPMEVEDIQDDPHYYQYVAGLEQYLVATLHPLSGHDIWIVRMPPPLVAPEAVFAALCNPFDEPGAHPARPRRYVTLEFGDREDAHFVCEWTSDGKHVNLGPSPRLTVHAFASAVAAGLGPVG